MLRISLIVGSMAPDFGWESLLLVIGILMAGVLLLGIEIFILPGFGIGGIIGLCFLLGGAITSWLILGPVWGALVMVCSCVAATAMVIGGMKSNFVKKRFVLDTQQPHGQGTESEELTALVGQRGTAQSDLRPAGVASIGDRRVDVVSDGDFIEQGTKIQVTTVDGPRVVVEVIDTEINTDSKGV